MKLIIAFTVISNSLSSEPELPPPDLPTCESYLVKFQEFYNAHFVNELITQLSAYKAWIDDFKSALNTYPETPQNQVCRRNVCAAFIPEIQKRMLIKKNNPQGTSNVKELSGSLTLTQKGKFCDVLCGKGGFQFDGFGCFVQT